MARRTTNPSRSISLPRKRAASPVVAGGLRDVYLLSDSTGSLARHMMAAFATQFPADTFSVMTRPFLDTIDKLDAAMDEVARRPGMVLHGMVEIAAKRAIERRCKKIGAPCRDLTGDFVAFLSDAAKVPPRPDRDRLHRVDQAYDRRIEALEFTLDHDDSVGLHTLHEAQIVLVGVSRTSKTPTSIYLAQQGFRVANVALAIEVPPPQQLLELPADRVVGLVVDPTVLTMIRTRRQNAWQMSESNYNDITHVSEELRWSRRLFERRGWKVIDVTGRAVEETAALVLQGLGLVHS